MKFTPHGEFLSKLLLGITMNLLVLVLKQTLKAQFDAKLQILLENLSVIFSSLGKLKRKRKECE